MPKTNTKNKKSQKTEAKNFNYKSLSIILGCVLVVSIGALIWTSATIINAKNAGDANYLSAEDKAYLELKDHISSHYVELMYSTENANIAAASNGEYNRNCWKEGMGTSRDNDFYISFWCQNSNPETGEPISDAEHNTLYFQHSETINGHTTGFAEALGD